MRDNFYESQFDIGKGKKISLMHVDSCFLLCATVTKNKTAYFESLDDETKKIFATNCDEPDDPIYLEMGNK